MTLLQKALRLFPTHERHHGAGAKQASEIERSLPWPSMMFKPQRPCCYLLQLPGGRPACWGDPKMSGSIMTGLSIFIEAQPRCEFAIRRCYRAVPLFRSVCNDLETAHAAWERWRREDAARAADYERLVGELLAELDGLLEAHRQNTIPEGSVARPRREEKG